MGAGLHRAGRARAILGVIALYGLLLQGFLLAMTPAAGPFAAGAAPICATDGDHGPDRGVPAAHDGHACCVAACAAGPPPLPALAGHEAAWPSREAAPVLWSASESVLSTGPPVSASSARGPPSA